MQLSSLNIIKGTVLNLFEGLKENEIVVKCIHLTKYYPFS